MPTCRGSTRAPLAAATGAAPQQVEQFAQENADNPIGPTQIAGRQPAPLLLDGGPSEIEHTDEDEEHHDRAGVDDDFERRRRRARRALETIATASSETMRYSSACTTFFG